MIPLLKLQCVDCSLWLDLSLSGSFSLALSLSVSVFDSL